MASKILIVEDEDQVREMLAEWLEGEGYPVFQAGNGQDGLRLLFDHRPDLVVVDLRMPGIDGFELCRRIRDVSSVPIMILSALSNQFDKVRGLDLGADEYVVKPIEMAEFTARIAAMLRRAQLGQPADPQPRYVDSLLDIDSERHNVLVRGRHVDLIPTEFRLLFFLAQRRGKVASISEMLKEVWGSLLYEPTVVK